MIRFQTTRPDSLDRLGWLWYSHDTSPPTDRPVVTGWQDPTRGHVRYARHYFMTDHAHLTIHPHSYTIRPLINDQWIIEIQDPGRAALFKLRYL